MKRSLWRIVLLLLPILCVGFSSCSDDDDEPKGSNDSNDELVGTWLRSPDDTGNRAGYTFNEDGTCVCYEGGLSFNATYEVRSDLLFIYWEYDNDPEIFTHFSVSDNSLSLIDTDGDVFVLYRANEVDGYTFIGTWIEDTAFETSRNVRFDFGRDGEFSYVVYEYSREVDRGNGEWWIEYDDGDMELHVSNFYLGGSNSYFSIMSSSSSWLTLREEHDDDMYHLTRWE